MCVLVYFTLVITPPQARLRLADVVEQADVNEAVRLMEMSKQSLEDDEEKGRWVGGGGERWAHGVGIHYNIFYIALCVGMFIKSVLLMIKK